jgi:tetratricopeptide (TPR) repeat protein
MNKFVLPLLLAITSSVSFGQTEVVLAKMDSFPFNIEKLDYLNKVINIEWRSSPQNIVTYARTYDSISKLIGANEFNAKSLNIQGMAKYVTEDYNKAISYYLESIRIIDAGRPSRELAQLYNNLASCFIKTDDFKNTEKYYLLSRDIAITIEDERRAANVNNNLSILYMNHNRCQQADEMLEKAIGFYLKNNDSINAGVAYMNQGNSKIFNEDFSGALSSYSLSKKYVFENQIPFYMPFPTQAWHCLHKAKTISGGITFIN